VKNIIAINVSPRKKGTSAMLLNVIKEELTRQGDSVNIIDLYSHLKKKEAIFEAIKTADTIVISGPCYTNTYPADTIWLLEEISAQSDILHGQSFYGIIQGGMPYAHTHISGLNMLKVFAQKVGMLYKGGFIMGMGAMLDGHPIEKHLNAKKIKRQFLIFCKHIHNGDKSPDSVYEESLLKFPRFVMKIIMFYINRSTAKEFAAKGIDVNQPSPYLGDEI
jgi:multimeric flavodoxin WrbA